MNGANNPLDTKGYESRNYETSNINNDMKNMVSEMKNLLEGPIN